MPASSSSRRFGVRDRRRGREQAFVVRQRRRARERSFVGVNDLDSEPILSAISRPIAANAASTNRTFGRQSRKRIFIFQRAPTDVEGHDDGPGPGDAKIKLDIAVLVQAQNGDAVAPGDP